MLLDQYDTNSPTSHSPIGLCRYDGKRLDSVSNNSQFSSCHSTVKGAKSARNKLVKECNKAVSEATDAVNNDKAARQQQDHGDSDIPKREDDSHTKQVAHTRFCYHIISFYHSLSYFNSHNISFCHAILTSYFTIPSTYYSILVGSCYYP